MVNITHKLYFISMDLNKYLIDHPKTHIIFDLDGTLAKLKIDWSTFRRGLFDIVGAIDRPLMESVPFEHMRGLELTNKAVKKHGESMKRQLTQFNESYELSHYSGYIPNPPLLSFIRENTSKYAYFLWTNNCRKTIEDFLVKERLGETFEKILTFDEVGLIKPEPEGFGKICDKRLPKTDYLMTGDSFADEGAAKSFGMDFFKVNFFG